MAKIGGYINVFPWITRKQLTFQCESNKMLDYVLTDWPFIKTLIVIGPLGDHEAWRKQKILWWNTYIRTMCSNQYTLCKWKVNHISYFSNFIKLLCNDVHCGEPIAYTGTWYAHWMWLSESFLEPKRLHDHQTSFQIVPHFDVQNNLKHMDSWRRLSTK